MMKKCLWMAWMVAVMSLTGGARGAEVRNVTAVQRWPWNGKVDVRFEVEGQLPASAVLAVTVEDRTAGKSYTAGAEALEGDTGKASGTHHVVWDLDAQGVSFQSTNVVFTVSYRPALYCVVDLSQGEYASSYPVTYMDVPPSGGFNTDLYKTTNLVLRRIDGGSFTMGSPTGEDHHDDSETQHQVTLTKSFYIGLFEVTQKQYKLVTGRNTSTYKGDKRPVETISWNVIRGNWSKTYDWPASSGVSADSFMGRLRARTGLAFDLPTEAQWEYACRAGTTTAYSYGGSENGSYMWYASNSAQGYDSKQPHEVGLKLPNPWGLYDMHGNVVEWCLDYHVSNLGTAAVTDPKGASSGTTRVHRGGSLSSSGWGCRSAHRGNIPPDNSGYGVGFRPIWILPE